MSALYSAKKLLQRLGHTVDAAQSTRLGYLMMHCKFCQDSFIFEDNGSMASLFMHDMVRITTWQSKAEFEQYVYDSFAKQALQHPYLYCGRLRVMI